MEASGLDGIVDCMSKWMSRKYFPHTDVSKVIETPIVKEENGKKYKIISSVFITDQFSTTISSDFSETQANRVTRRT